MAESIKVSIRQQANCNDCRLASTCLPLPLNDAEMGALDQIIKRNRPLNRQGYLFRQGDRFRSIYAVRSGILKTFTVSDGGEEHITGFYLPGELVGLSGMDTNAYPGSAQALDTTSICEIPFDQLDELSAQIPQLRRQLIRMMSREIRDDQQMMLLLSKKTAEERLATFLINLSVRISSGGFSTNQFRLNMSRGEIGNYLGLAMETVSRLFARFQESGLIKYTGKEVSILNYSELCATAGGRTGL